MFLCVVRQLVSIVLFNVFASSGSRSVRKAPSNCSTVSHEGGPILLGDMEFLSRQQFVATGARCRTPASTSPKNALLLSDVVDSKQNAPYTIWVFFHVIRASSGLGDISMEAIHAQLDALNSVFHGMFNVFEFRLAGIDRHINNAWFTVAEGSVEEKAMKKALHKGTYADLNVYTTGQPDGTLGWASLPTDSTKHVLQADGVVLDYRTFPGGGFWPYNLGISAVHEVGHWLGLDHTFQGGCDEDTQGGDGVPDTPAQAMPQMGCPARAVDSCPGNIGALKGQDLRNNYMDYLDDRCMGDFTSGQLFRMHAYWRMYRCPDC